MQLAQIPFVTGRCFEKDMRPYKALSDAFKSLLPFTEKSVLDKYGNILVKIITDLKDRGFKSAPTLDEFAEKDRLLENILAWLNEISQKTPFVIYIEDIHWSDFSSIELLNACIRNLSKGNILILTSFRDDEVEASSAIYHTVEEKLTEMLTLTPLDLSNVEILIKSMLGKSDLSDDFTEQVFNSTGGNPFFVSEIMRNLIEQEKLKLERGNWILPADVRDLELPTSVEETIFHRLELLSWEALHIARAASAVGRRMSLSSLKVVSGLPDEKLFEILDELLERQFMVMEEQEYVFTHDRVRESLYAQLDDKAKQLFHEKVGDYIETRHSDDLSSVTAELAYHYSRGRDKRKAIDYLVKSAEIARDYTDWEKVSELLREALVILEANEDYPNRKTKLFFMRDRAIEALWSSHPQECIELSDKQFNELFKLRPR